MRDYLVKERLCSPSKVIVLGQGSVNGVDAEGKFSPSSYPPELRVSTRSQYGIPAEATVLGFVGRIVRDKGMHELAEAWRTLSSHYPDIHLLLVGPFESKDMLLPNDQALFSTHPRIHLAGWRTDIPAHFAAMDIFVMPSYREGFGVTNIEAAAMELPVVSTRIPGCVDSIQDGVTGILVPAHDAVALAGAMRTYIDHPELRLQHGQAGRVRVLRDFRPEMVWDGLLREYQGQLKNRARTVSSLST
jgi:glycosyltransferase involved in cell wall biosynthesis